MNASRIAGLLLATALLVAADFGIARADSFTWDTTVAPSNGTSPNSNGVLGTWTSNGQSISAEGFQVLGNSASTKLSTDFTALTNSGSLSGRGAFEYSGNGIGITDQYEPTNSSPQHTVSNEATHRTGSWPNYTYTQVTDFVVFQLPGNGYIPTSLQLQQWCSDGSHGASGCGSASNGSSNVSVFIGGSTTGTKAIANLGALTTLAANSTSLNDLMSTYGFQQYTNTETGNTLNGSGDRTVNLNSSGANLSGAYLIVAASLNDPSTNPDYFKIQGINALSPTTPPTQVPEPGTLAVFGFGLAGLFVARRRMRSRS